jgi:hypothetical protein
MGHKVHLPPDAARRKARLVIEAMRSGSRSHRMLALAVLACALALRMLVPQGWMPVSDAHGFRITMCSGTGPMDMTIAMPGMTMHGKADHAPQQPMQEHPCTFAHLGMALAEPPSLTLPLPPFAQAEALALKTPAVAIGRGLAAPPPPSTGPPTLL